MEQVDNLEETVESVEFTRGWYQMDRDERSREVSYFGSGVEGGMMYI